MKINNTIRKEANKIISRYCGLRLPNQISAMYDELELIGITIPMFSSNFTDAHPIEYNGELIENSCFIYHVYEDTGTSKNEYNMYIS